MLLWSTNQPSRRNPQSRNFYTKSPPKPAPCLAVPYMCATEGGSHHFSNEVLTTSIALMLSTARRNQNYFSTRILTLISSKYEKEQIMSKIRVEK